MLEGKKTRDKSKDRSRERKKTDKSKASMVSIKHKKNSSIAEIEQELNNGQGF